MVRRPCAEFRAGCINRADIYYPSNPGPWPVIVTVHGRPRTQRDMVEVARALAAKGAVVFNVDYRGVRPVSKGFPESVADVSCAVRFARQNAKAYGGDRHHVVLVGHSQGGYVSTMVALSGDTFSGARGSCKSTLAMKTSRPEGLVLVAAATAIHRTYRIDQTFLGGTYEQIPEVWERASLYTHIGRNKKLKVGIIFERHDPYLGIGHAVNPYRALRTAGYKVELVLLDHGTTHFDLLDTDPGHRSQDGRHGVARGREIRARLTWFARFSRGVGTDDGSVTARSARPNLHSGAMPRAVPWWW